MLETKNLTYRVSGSFSVEDVQMSFSPGKVHGIIGRNGCGKSTVLRLLAGLLTPFSGNIAWNGKPIQSIRPVDLAQQRALLSQSTGVYGSPTVLEVIELAGSESFHLRQHPSVQEITDRLQIRNLLERPYDQLSGGEKQRVQLCRVLAQLSIHADGHTPRLLLLDEPLNNLDIYQQFLFMKEIRRFADAGNVVVMVVHDMLYAARHLDFIYGMKEGRVHFSGEPDRVLLPEILMDLFGYPEEMMHYFHTHYDIYAVTA